MLLADSTWNRSHLNSPSLFFSYWEDLKCQFLSLFFLCHSKSLWAHLKRASHSVAFRQVQLCPTRNLLSPPLLPQTLYLPFGMLSNPSSQPSPILCPLSKCMGVIRCPEGRQPSRLQNCSGVPAGFTSQEGIRECRSLLLARWVFLSQDCMGLGCQSGADILIWGDSHQIPGEFRALGYP